MINLKNKKVVVFGMGVSGISALKLLQYLGADCFAINAGLVNSWAKTGGVLDILNIDHCACETDDLAQQFVNEAELLILSPGIPREHSILEVFHKKQKTIWGEIELGFQVLKSIDKLKPIIAITGTNGKTTTTTFLGEMFEYQGLKPFIGGNIGTPFCDMAYEVLTEKTNYDYILLELSSFQLESIVDFRPNIAIILNIFQNHGERYEKIEDYALAKFNITKNMKTDDALIYPSDYPIILKWAEKLNINKISFNTQNFEIPFDLNSFKLPGQHNKVNLNFILKVGQICHFKQGPIQECINNFNGVHFRIEYIPTSLGFKAFNDAKSTNWDATLTAVNAMDEFKQNLYLIIGGKKRGHGDSILPHLNELSKKVKRFYLIGEMANELENELMGQVDYLNLVSLDKTMEHIKSEHFNGVVLFSPAFPSFDQYANYVKRGEHFSQLVR